MVKNSKKNRKKFSIEKFSDYTLTERDESWITNRSIILREKGVVRHNSEAIKDYFRKFCEPLYLINKRSNLKYFYHIVTFLSNLFTLLFSRNFCVRFEKNSPGGGR